MKTICEECCHECGAVEETFDYAGSHCSNGRAGVHHTGHYVSDCCLAEVSEGYDYDEDETIRD